MTVNVDGYEVWRDDDVIVLRFVDVFEDGEEIRLPQQDAARLFRDGLSLCDPYNTSGQAPAVG